MYTQVATSPSANTRRAGDAGPRGGSLHTFRGELMQAAQRRDLGRLKSIVSSLIHEHRLDASQLNACLVLHHVLWAGELNDLAEFLLQLGCDPYFPDIHGDTAFHYCVRACNLKFLKSFHLAYGSSLFEVLNNNHFNLLLTAAAESSDDKAYEILNVLEWLYLSGVSIESHDANGKTGLMWACQRGSLVVVQWFLSRGANLAHRDHNGRTVLMMACLSGDEETVRTVCEAGAINSLECESNDDRESNTAIKLCWNKGHFFLGLSLRQWHFQKRVFGCMRIFRNAYAWYYWTLMGMNFIISLAMSAALIQTNYDYWYHCIVFFSLFAVSQLFWVIACAANPGYVKHPVIPDQSYRCSTSLKFDVSQRPVFAYRVTSACYKLQLLEREAARVSAELTALNRHYGVRAAQNVQLPPDGQKKFEASVIKIQRIREHMLALLERVGQERRSSCPPGYAKQVMDAMPRRVCLTCRIVKPFRAHHCGDCAHCVHRFDHHCIWVDNCIGRGNQRSFLFFLLFLTASIVDLWVLVGIYYAEEILGRDDSSLDLFAQPLFYAAFFNSLLNLLWAGFVGYLFGRTFKSMLTNITFYEYLKKPSHIQKRFRGQVTGCCWDLSDLTIWRALRNIHMFFSGRNDWDGEDYPEYVDNIPAAEDTGPAEPMLPRGRQNGPYRRDDEEGPGQSRSVRPNQKKYDQKTKGTEMTRFQAIPPPLDDHGPSGEAAEGFEPCETFQRYSTCLPVVGSVGQHFVPYQQARMTLPSTVQPPGSPLLSNTKTSSTASRSESPVVGSKKAKPGIDLVTPFSQGNSF